MRDSHLEISSRNKGKYDDFIKSTIDLLLEGKIVLIGAINEEHGFDIYTDLKNNGLSLEFKHRYRKEPTFPNMTPYTTKYAGTSVWMKN